MYRLVLGADGGSGVTASAACTLDKRPVGNGSIFCVTHPDGRKYVLHAKTSPNATRPHASQNYAVDAYRVYVLFPVVPRRLGALLALQ